MKGYDEIELDVKEIIEECATDKELLTATLKKLENVYKAKQRKIFGFNKHNESFMDTLVIRAKGKNKIATWVRFNFNEFQEKIDAFLTNPEIEKQENIDEKLNRFLKITTGVQNMHYVEIDSDHRKAYRYEMELIPNFKFEQAHSSTDEEKEKIEKKINAVKTRMENEALYLDINEFLFHQKEMYSSFINNSESLRSLANDERIDINKLAGLDQEKFMEYVLRKMESKSSSLEEKGFSKKKVNV